MTRTGLCLAFCLTIFASFQPALANETSLASEGSLHTYTLRPAEPETDGPPLVVEIAYTSDIWRAAKGGVRTGTRYLDNLDIVAEADMERLVGWKGAKIGVYGLYNNGKSLSGLMGDAQVASNIETGVRALRLYEAWVDQKIGNKASVRVGLYDLNSEFDALESSSLFMGSAHGIGTDISQSGENGPSIFPSTSLAVRLAIEPSSGWTIRAAILDGVPGDPARPKRTAIKLGQGDGALLVGEVEAPLPRGKLLFGHWRYTARAGDVFGTGQQRNSGFYLRGESRLIPEGDDTNQGLSAFFRTGIANGRVNQFDRFASLGMSYTGLIKGRDQDQLGLAMASAFTSSDYRLASPSTKAETVVELTYRAPLTRWLTLQPNVQYVINPGTDPTLSDALAFGLRFELGFKLPS